MVWFILNTNIIAQVQPIERQQTIAKREQLDSTDLVRVWSNPNSCIHAYLANSQSSSWEAWLVIWNSYNDRVLINGTANEPPLLTTLIMPSLSLILKSHPTCIEGYRHLVGLQYQQTYYSFLFLLKLFWFEFNHLTIICFINNQQTHSTEFP